MMADYIERELAKAYFTPSLGVEIIGTVSVAVESLLQTIDNIPAADVREVVLCRDCKWTKADGMEDPAIYCKKWDRWEMPPDGFCWLGEKREES